MIRFVMLSKDDMSCDFVKVEPRLRLKIDIDIYLFSQRETKKKESHFYRRHATQNGGIWKRSEGFRDG